MAAEDLDLDVESEEEAPAASGGSMKIILIGVALALILSLALFGVLYFSGLLGGDDEGQPAEAQAEAQSEAQAEPEKAAAKAGSGKPKPPQLYYPLEPPFVVNFGLDSDIRFLQLSVQLGAYDAQVMQQVKDNAPAIRDELVMLLSGQDPKKLMSREGKEALRKEVLASVRKVMKAQTGKPGVENVYFTSFVMQ